MFCALFRKGVSKLVDFTTDPEFSDVISMLRKMGANIIIRNNVLYINGKSRLKGVEYTTVNDRNDFITLLSAALTTNSQIEICGVDYKRMKLDALDKVAKRMNIRIEYKNRSCIMNTELNKMKTTTIKAGRYPDLQTEWQVLFAPLLTQITGTSRTIELLYPNRMQHWKELEKMGACYEFYKSKIKPEFPHSDSMIKNPPNAVKVFGPIQLHGARVKALDVRAGAAMIIAGLAAHGRTEITNVDQIERGYENIIRRLQSLGANIQIRDQ